MTSKLTAHNCPFLAGLLVLKMLQISFQRIKEYSLIISVKESLQGTESSLIW